ncbi:ABC transporter permease [Leucobacter luti]|uniref:Peptide/nickel transport system permease protein n=1 Tax=Leucobacter luti TaxID=340320 RepID=A0A4R6RSJ2_9MICO|nr:ABC transporter permease [Leucobacter luti]MCW2289910.1 ABC-type dipeptide/oligopeptide/nickel transport system permease component [Leucobacter luti]QYM76950.1 ABC transporter permease [Leucobacter luti]TCK36079.1 peptide/nickel transport system permease protein [Leucobacter luti]TDP89821.1 peptide/nickel transport system permease protein [Leucobacter luti]
MHRGRYIWHRTVFALITVFVAISLNFVLFRVLPGSAVTRISRVPNASPELKEALEKQFGLDKSVWEQYLLYLKGLFTGNLGVSFNNRQPVAENLSHAFMNTLPLVLTGTIIALIIGILLGVLSAVRRGSIFDHTMTNISVLFYAFPTQFLGAMLLIAFAGVLPSAGMSDPFAAAAGPWDQFLDQARHLILPVATLVLTLYAENLLIMRSAVLETLGEDYILTARAKGLSRGRIIRSYAIRNAMLPTVTMIALALGTVVSGAILIEVIYSWPGIGRALYEAVLQRDYPMLQGGFLIITIIVVVCNYLADLSYAWIDPRVAN